MKVKSAFFSTMTQLFTIQSIVVSTVWRDFQIPLREENIRGSLSAYASPMETSLFATANAGSKGTSTPFVPAGGEISYSFFGFFPVNWGKYCDWSSNNSIAGDVGDTVNGPTDRLR